MPHFGEIERLDYLAQVLEQLGVAGVQLKWPNDVLIHGRKLAGVLVELSSGQRRGVAAVVGIPKTIDNDVLGTDQKWRNLAKRQVADE